MRTPRALALVRAPLWWSPKLLPLVAACELAALAAQVPPRAGLARLAATLVSAVATAAFAHLLNDLADVASDRAAGKANLVDATGRARTVALMAGLALIAVLPWFVVPLDPGAGLTLGAIVALSVAYSAPPLRLKTRGVAGVVVDALVAHTLPTLFAFLQLGAAGMRTGAWWVALVAAIVWATGFGMRSIVVHQLLDADGDRASGQATYVVRRGRPRSIRLGRDAFGLELAGLVVLAGVVTWLAWGAALFFVAHFALWLAHRRLGPGGFDSVPTRPGAWLPLAEFYELWPALVLGIALGVGDAMWWWVPIAVVVLFWPVARKQSVDQVVVVVELARHHLTPLWWATYRGYWRVRHAVWDRAVAWVRRQRRRARRRLHLRRGRPPSN